MTFGDEGNALGCDRHRCGLRTSPGLAALACVAQRPSAPCRPGESSSPAYPCRTRRGQRAPIHAVSTGYDLMEENEHAGGEMFHRLAVGGQFPEIGATLDPAQPLFSQRSNTRTWSSGGTYTC